MNANFVTEKSPESLLDQSLKFYQAGQFEECIAAARSALSLRPDLAAAWNNICAACNMLGRYEEGIAAGKQALILASNYSNAKANLAWSVRELRKLRQASLGPHSAKILIAIYTCKKYADRVKAQFDTWVPEAIAAGYDVQVFDGERLGVGDDYYSLSKKTKALCAYALENGYDHMLKIDDDSYIRVSNFKPVFDDYAGVKTQPSDKNSGRVGSANDPEWRPVAAPGTYPHFYATGAAYWLSARSMKIISHANITDLDACAEDRWVGNILANHGIELIELAPDFWRSTSGGHPESSTHILLDISSPELVRSLHSMKDISEFRESYYFVNQSLYAYNQRNYAECIALAKTAIKLKPEYPEAFNNIAASYMALGQWDLAIDAADKALQFRPDFQRAKSNRAAAIAEKTKQSAFSDAPIAIVMGTLITSAKPEEQHLGGNPPEGDGTTFYPELWAYLAKEYNVKKILDLGCGDGVALKYWDQELHVKCVGIDGLRHNVLKTREKGITCYEYDFESDKPFNEEIGQFDLCWTCEFVEHVEACYVDRIIDLISKAKYVAMTHALPGQEGYHHVNCQPGSYWIDLLEKNGFRFEPEISSTLRTKAHDYFARSGLFFVKN